MVTQKGRTRTKTDGTNIGKKTSGEESVLTKLFELTGNKAKSYYIVWRFAPHLLPKENIVTFENLHNTYKFFTEGMNERLCENWLSEAKVQAAVKWLLKRLHQQKMINLYNTYYEKAQNDTQAFKAFIEFSDKFLATEKESELLSIINGLDFSESEKENKGD